MSILKSLVSDGGLVRQIQQGDVLAAAEVIPATIATTTSTITGAQLASGIIQRTPVANATDTIDTAANIIAAISSSSGNTPLQSGTTFRFSIINRGATFTDTVTVTANTGVTVTDGTINAVSVKDFLVTVVNGTPAQSLQGTTVNGSAVISGFTQAQLSLLTVGMVVTNAVANFQGQTIISININAGTVTMSANGNATNVNPVTVSFSPVVTIAGLGQKLI